ncbi:S1C family serine protease [Aestuariivirga sp.]|uniref:S1C family serine protease n=1 Tax=Aestuariivirga sp. TaxID=2650926 RepID=UPI0039E72AE9
MTSEDVCSTAHMANNILQLAMRGVLTFFAVTLLHQVNSAWSREIKTFDSYSWHGGVYTDEVTDEFTHCAASAEFRNGFGLIVAVTKQYNWVLGFTKSRGLPPNVSSMNYRFDGGKWHQIPSKMSPDGTTIYVDMPEDDSVGEFRRAHTMEIFFRGEKYGFDLGGSSGMLADLVSCVDVNRTPVPVSPSQQPSAGNDSQAASEKETASTAASPPRDNKDASSSGTGIIVTASGDVLTNFHVVQGCKTLQLGQAGQLPMSANVMATDVQNDLAVVRPTVTWRPNAIAQFRPTRPRLGESVAVFGFPLTGTLSSSGNFVVGTVSSLAGIGDDARLLQISAPIQPGNSGGPLLDSSGNVIGVVNAKLNEIAFASATGALPQNVNFAIKGNVAQNFMDAHSVGYGSNSDAQTLDASAVAEKAQLFTVQILCNQAK